MHERVSVRYGKDDSDLSGFVDVAHGSWLGQTRGCGWAIR